MRFMETSPQEKILQERVKEAVRIAVYAMGVDGDHHRVWTLDQIVRLLAAEDYKNVVENFKANTGKDWGVGIEP